MVRAWLAAATMACGLLGATGAGAAGQLIFSDSGTVQFGAWGPIGDQSELQYSFNVEQVLETVEPVLAANPIGPFDMSSSTTTFNYEVVFYVGATILEDESVPGYYMFTNDYEVFPSGLCACGGFDGFDGIGANSEERVVAGGISKTLYSQDLDVFGSNVTLPLTVGETFFDGYTSPGEYDFSEDVSINAIGAPYSAQVYFLGTGAIVEPDIPEPASWAIMLVGLAGIGVNLRRSAQNAPKVTRQHSDSDQPSLAHRSA